MKSKKKSKLFLFLIVFVVFISLFIKHRINIYKSKEPTYVAENYLTSSIFKTKKLYQVNSIYLKFSDGNMAVMEVSGLQGKSPHKKVTYELFLEKTSKGYWKVKKSHKFS